MRGPIWEGVCITNLDKSGANFMGDSNERCIGWKHRCGRGKADSIDKSSLLQGLPLTRSKSILNNKKFNGIAVNNFEWNKSIRSLAKRVGISYH